MTKGAKIAIIVLAVLLVLAIVFAIIVAMKLRKEKKASMNPADVLKNYVNTLPVYASNQDAIDAGLKAGDRFRTSQTADTFSTVTVVA